MSRFSRGKEVRERIYRSLDAIEPVKASIFYPEEPYEKSKEVE